MIVRRLQLDYFILSFTELRLQMKKSKINKIDPRFNKPQA